MHLHRIRTALAVVLLGGLLAAGFFTRTTWLAWLRPVSSSNKEEDKHEAHGTAAEVPPVKLSEQAQANLRLVVKPLTVETYWRTIAVPGQIVDRPGQSDRGIVSPVTGVLTKVHHFPGDVVKPGDTLFTLRLLSETLHLTQSDLFKTTKEIEITRDEKKRLAAANVSGAIPEVKMIEIDNQLRRLSVAAQAYRTELLTRGLTPEQIDGVAEGKFVAAIEIPVPRQRSQPTDSEPKIEVQELKVELGQQVQAGQTTCLLSDHQSLYVEGRAFRQEITLLAKAAKEDWPVQIEFLEEGPSDWPALEQVFTIRHVANTVDPVSRTCPFYLPLHNQSRSYEKNGKTLLSWRFRPGQRVRLHVRCEKLENVFVLPTDAVVREGPEAYVFRQNGDLFDRKPVHVVYQDRQNVVIANDGSVPSGVFVAQNGATQMNRVLKSAGGGPPPGFHVHADGSIHSNSAHK